MPGSLPSPLSGPVTLTRTSLCCSILISACSSGRSHCGSTHTHTHTRTCTHAHAHTHTHTHAHTHTHTHTNTHTHTLTHTHCLLPWTWCSITKACDHQN